MKTTEIGRLGETAVCRQLEQQGYSIVRRNFCVRGGEIDIIAENGEYLAACKALSDKQSVSMEREISAFGEILHTWDSSGWVILKNGEFLGYASVSDRGVAT